VDDSNLKKMASGENVSLTAFFVYLQLCLRLFLLINTSSTP